MPSPALAAGCLDPLEQLLELAAVDLKRPHAASQYIRLQRLAVHGEDDGTSHAGSRHDEVATFLAGDNAAEQ